jgi:hypothetical protein
VVEGRFIFGTSGHGSAEAERFITLMRCLAHLSLLGGSTTREAAPGLHRGQKVCPTREMF